MLRWMLATVTAAVLLASPAMADQLSALNAVKAQPRVVDAELDKSGNMYVLVKAESINWTQIASSLCNVVKPHQARIFRIRMIELTQANHTKQPATWTRLAEGDCSK